MNPTQVAILRGGGRQGAVVYEQISQYHAHIFVWDDGGQSNNSSIHPLLAALPRISNPSDLSESAVLKSSSWVPGRHSEHDDGDEKKLDDAATVASSSQSITISCYVAVGSSHVRKNLVQSVQAAFSELKQSQNHRWHVQFPSVIHPTAVISPTATIGAGCFIGPNALVNTYATVGDFSIINSSALIEHDVILEPYCTINPAAVLLGSVQVVAGVTIGANATVRNAKSIRVPNATIGMGAAVVSDINAAGDGFWGGVPARPMGTSSSLQQELSSLAISTKSSSTNDNRRIRWCVQKPFSSQRLLDYLQPSLIKGHLTNDGPLQPIICHKIQAMVRSNRKPLMACNGTSALHAIVAGITLQRDAKQRSSDKEKRPLQWVTQAFTFPSSIQGPLSQAMVCDIDEKLFGPSMAFLEKHKDTIDGVIVTNVFGLQTDIIAYEKWCDQNFKYLVLDNAASPLGFISDQRCIHDVGDAAFISLHETKPFGRGEGGAIFARPDLQPFIHQAMNFGYDIANQVRVPNRLSSNWRMSDISAAAICDHLDNIRDDKWEERFQELTRIAVKQLQSVGLQLAIPVRYPTILSCLFVKLPDGTNAEATCKRLNSYGVEAKHYYSPIVLTPTQAPVAWDLFDSTICLPFHLDLTENKIQFMIDLLVASTRADNAD